MILITDSHVSEASGNVRNFFDMLKLLEKTRHDLVFLGDIFDLWIALPGYEGESHQRFINWCRTQKTQRNIGFVEGNHEFFLTQRHKNAFSWCDESAGMTPDAGVYFCHGDLINRSDRGYLRFRRFTKNRWVKILLHWLPLGPQVVRLIKKGLKKREQPFRKYDPSREIQKFANSHFSNGVRTIFSGHFHFEKAFVTTDGKRIYLLPDWQGTEKITLFDEETGAVTSGHWQKLLKDIQALR